MPCCVLVTDILRNFAATPAARWVAGVVLLYGKGCAAGCRVG